MSIQLVNNTPEPIPEDQFEVSRSIRKYADDKEALEAGLIKGEMYYNADGFVKIVIAELEE